MKIDNLEVLSAKEVTGPTFLLVSLIIFAFACIVIGICLIYVCLIYANIYSEKITILVIGLLFIIGGVVTFVITFIGRADLTYKYTEYTVVAVGQIDYEEFNKYYKVVYDSDYQDTPTIFKIREKD